VLLASAFVLMLLAFIGAPRATSEIVGLAVQETFKSNKIPLLPLVALAIGLIAKDIQQFGILITFGIVGIGLSTSYRDESAEELGQSLIGQFLLLTLFATATRSTKQLYYSRKHQKTTEILNDQSNANPLETKINQNYGILILFTLAALFFGIYILSKDSREDTYLADANATMGMESAGNAANDVMAVKDIENLSSSLDTGVPEFNYSSDSLLGESVSAPKYRTSYDCSKASGFVEITICGNEALAKQDVELSTNFKKRLAALSGKEKADFLIRERRKLAERDICFTEECLRNWYSKYLAQTESVQSFDERLRELELNSIEESKALSKQTNSTIPENSASE
jgi:uncharacterized protein